MIILNSFPLQADGVTGEEVETSAPTEGTGTPTEETGTPTEGTDPPTEGPTNEPTEALPEDEAADGAAALALSVVVVLSALFY